ncbi:transport and Golgi organization protein 2-like protein [Platysternon megacephalum]|uniref:Transport and Golgi organization protein 2-like protein n=1 Tax=Platysternon megacephalum TaxID=55544 RepID=A0A4D9EYB4_9SAUR|nr:transport and Golgi organization protein 2-like protein [Platysternon megacephalum]
MKLRVPECKAKGTAPANRYLNTRARRWASGGGGAPAAPWEKRRGGCRLAPAGPERWAMAAAVLLAAALGGGLLLIARRYLTGAGRASRAAAAALMRGKTVIVTGANSGLGRATAAELLRMQARVIMGCRDRGRAEQAAREIRAELGAQAEGGELVIRELDLASLRSVRSFCQRVLQEEPRLDVLINNAGIFQCPYMKTEDGFEMQFGVNHLGHFLLTNLLLGLLKSSAPSRIVVVSSKLYKYGEINFEDLNSEISYNKSFGYSRSKLANILFTRELARRLEGTGVTVNVLHPGIVRTNLGRYINIPLLAKPLFNLVSWAFFKTPLEGAQTSIYLASSAEVEGVSGKYFGDCKEEELLPKAMDDLVARKLWDISEVMVGLLK